MSRVIHARLDAHTEKLLRDLERQLGWNDSKIIREGIKTLSTFMAGRRRPKVIGLGRFKSGVSDLGSSKRHLQGFGN